MKVESVNPASAASSTALAYSFTGAAARATRRLAIVAISQEADTAAPDSVTMGGQSLGSPIHSVFLDDATDLRVDIYAANEALIATMTGADIAVSGANAETTIHAVTAINAKQSSFIGNTNEGTSTSTNPISFSLTVGAGSGIFAFGVVGNASNAATWGSDLTERTEINDASHAASVATGSYGTGASKTISCTWSNHNRSILVALEILPFDGDYAIGDRFFFLGGTTTLLTRNGGSFSRKAFGAGGAGGLTQSSGVGGSGGGGGFASETRDVESEETWLVEVGAGGIASAAEATASTGGQLVGIYRTSRSEANFDIIAGSGGAAGHSQPFSGDDGGNGGAGGGTSGTNGTEGLNGGSPVNDFGNGGSDSAGGAGGSLSVQADGSAGSALTGGVGGNGGAGGGDGGDGGAGRYGGGGGEGSGSGDGSGGGGGGSGKVTGTSTTLTAGSGTTPAGTSDDDYVTGIGVGGAAGVNGGAGMIVIEVLAIETTGTIRTLLGVGF